MARHRLVSLVVAGAVALAAAGTAGAATSSEFDGHHVQRLRVVVVPALNRGNLAALEREGAALGLVVPNAGPRTSAADAFAGMVRGILYNGRLSRPKDSILIRVEHSRTVPTHGPAIVLAMPPQHTVSNTERYPIAVLGRGYHGILVSKLTKVPGLVSMADVARTALATSNRLGSRPARHPRAALSALEARIVASRGSTMAGSVLVLSLLVFFALLYPRGAPAAIGAALGENLLLGWWGGDDPVANVALLGVCLVLGGLLGPRVLRSKAALGLFLGGVVAAYAVAMAVHPSALSLAPMGPELTSRFFGVSNLIETLLLAPALLAGKLLGERFGPGAFAAVAVLSLATIAENQLGADGGGAFVVAVAFALLAAGMWARSWLSAVPALALAALAAFALLDVDAATKSPDHLSGALHGGVHGLVRVAVNRVPLSYDRILEQWWLLFPGIPAVCVGVAAVRYARSRADAALVLSLLAGLATSVVLNDSPGAVAIAGLASLLALESGLLHRGLVVPLLRRFDLSPAPAVGSPRPQE
ncbi:MAG TPA: hypothetical protein VFJ77_10280 [Gaiellaceae bacterium]|nr:hypothetical protein [Gaiellaceae bacterium]